MKRVFVAASLFAGLSLLGVASCSLGLDESLIEKAHGGTGVYVPPDGAADGALADANGGTSDGGASIECTDDVECASTDGCLHGKCDVARSRCVFDVCRPAACTAGVCDRQAKTCSGEAPYKLQASQFKLDSKLACAHCAAAVYPWLFAITASGVVAYDVSNPASSTPPQVPVVGVGFVPVALAQSGSRVWMLGSAVGAGPSRLELAYLDAPANPFVEKLAAHTVLATYDRKAETLSIFPRAGESALLVAQTAPGAAAAVEAPLVEPVSIDASEITVTANFVPNAVSGDRLLMGAVVNQAASFYLIEKAGSAAPANGTTANLTSVGAVSTQHAFAQGDDGTVFWATGVHQGVGPAATTRAARGYFLVPGAAGQIDAQAGVDIEVYTNVGMNAAVFGANQAAAAMLDANTVMVAAQAHENANQTAVQFVTKAPLGLLVDGAAPRRKVVDVKIGDVGATVGSHGIGYLIASDDTSSTTYVFDSACVP
jgi:hypothetical protein